MGMFEFFHMHPFIAWCALWLGWAVLPFTIAILNFILKSVTLLVSLVRGWPEDPRVCTIQNDCNKVESSNE